MKRRKWRQTLKVKISLIVVGVLLLLSAIMSILMHQAMSELLRRQAEQYGLETASYIAALSGDDILLNDRYALFERIRKAGANNHDIRYILVCDYTGQVIVHTFGDTIPADLLSLRRGQEKDEPQIMNFSSNEGTIYEATAPVESGKIGFIRVGVLPKGIASLFNQKMYDFWMMTALILIGAAFWAVFLAMRMIKPLSDLALAIDQVAKENYAVHADYDTFDEIARLSRSFNLMTLKLSQKQQENTRLLQALREKEVNRAELIKKLFTAQEDERRRLSRELHDGAGQSVTSILAYLRVLLLSAKDEKQKGLLDEARTVIVDVLEDIRQMAVSLRPPVLDEFGVAVAMEKYLNGVRAQQNLAVHFVFPDALTVPDQVALALYRILQESVTNIIKHAHATQVDICLTADQQSVILYVADNGCGFHADALKRARDTNRLGVYGMKERVELLHGNFSIESETGNGTVVSAAFPLRAELPQPTFLLNDAHTLIEDTTNKRG